MKHLTISPLLTPTAKLQVSSTACLINEPQAAHFHASLDWLVPILKFETPCIVIEETVSRHPSSFASSNEINFEVIRVAKINGKPDIACNEWLCCFLNDFWWSRWLFGVQDNIMSAEMRLKRVTQMRPFLLCFWTEYKVVQGPRKGFSSVWPS